MKTVKLKIEIDTSNDAMQEAPGEDVAELLRGIADMIQYRTPDRASIRDANGNHIGYWSYSAEDDADEDEDE